MQLAKRARAQPPTGAFKISEEFGCRPNTLRERLVNALGRRYRKQVASAELVKIVYGSEVKDTSHGSLMMIVKGAQGMIRKRKLRYVIKKERNERARSRWGCTRPQSADFAKKA